MYSNGVAIEQANLNDLATGPGGEAIADEGSVSALQVSIPDGFPRRIMIEQRFPHQQQSEEES